MSLCILPSSWSPIWQTNAAFKAKEFLTLLPLNTFLHKPAALSLQAA